MRDINLQIASRNTEAVLLKILQKTQWRIIAEEDMLDKRIREEEICNSSPNDCGLRANDQMVKMECRQ